MPQYLTSMNAVVKDVLHDMLKQQENIILEQLGDLVKKDLLQIESTQPVLIQEPFNNGIKLQQSVRLNFKGFERIAELEKENMELKDQLKNVLGLKERLKNE